ncbi:MAG TPA: sigma-70 family RNA polymerase sigma factor [Longimicrobium sp.]|nr:sigma-70 family RNA polymerase sigma factor [Longimicrobium sp.]
MPPGGERDRAQEREQAETLLVANLKWVEHSVSSLCRRYGLSGAEAEDVCSWVKVKLVEDDYAPFRKFRGDSSIRTYLVVVVAALFRDYRAGHWGRWRPSAAALRGGHLTVRLETLVYRDGCTLDQAARTLREAGDTDQSDGELARLLSTLPVRGPLRPYEAGEDSLEGIDGGSSADDLVATDEAERTRETVFAALERVLARLPDEDRLIIRLHYWKGLSVADVSRALGLPQKPLYRRIERILVQLRSELPAEGVRPEQLRDFMGALPVDAQSDQMDDSQGELPP